MNNFSKLKTYLGSAAAVILMLAILIFALDPPSETVFSRTSAVVVRYKESSGVKIGQSGSSYDLQLPDGSEINVPNYFRPIKTAGSHIKLVIHHGVITNKNIYVIDPSEQTDATKQ